MEEEERVVRTDRALHYQVPSLLVASSSFSVFLSSLEISDSHVDEPYEEPASVQRQTPLCVPPLLISSRVDEQHLTVEQRLFLLAAR